jgi:hypothetical protein
MKATNNKIPSLEYKPPYLKQPLQMYLHIGAYLNNNGLFIGLIDADEYEPYTDLTVNVDGSEKLAPYQAAVKNYSENEGIEKFIEAHSLGTPTGQTIRSEYVLLPVYQFNREKLLAHSINGVQEYEARRIGRPNQEQGE